MSKVNRRKFISAAVGGAIVAAAGYGYYHYSKSPEQVQETATTSQTPLTSTPSTENRPPVADFYYEPSFIDPAVDQTIDFINKSKDPDNDDLKYTWFLDDEESSEAENLSTKLSESQHKVELVASDGKYEDSKEVYVNVVEDQLFSLKDLHVDVKGVCYCTGQFTFNQFGYPEPIMKQHLRNIKEELDCNGIRIFGNNDDTLLLCAELAIDEDFDVISLCPRYIGNTIDDTARKLEQFAKRADELRSKSDSIELQVGNELSVDAAGIFSGGNWVGKAGDVGGEIRRSPGWEYKLNNALKKLIEVSRKSFNGKLSYAAGNWETSIPWYILDFDIIGFNGYLYKDYLNESKLIKMYKELKRSGKPVYITEFGSGKNPGACMRGGAGWTWGPTAQIDEWEQANCLKKYLPVFNEARPKGVFLYEFVHNMTLGPENDDFGILTGHRTKGYYMYKSFERVVS